MTSFFEYLEKNKAKDSIHSFYRPSPSNKDRKENRTTPSNQNKK